MTFLKHAPARLAVASGLVAVSLGLAGCGTSGPAGNTAPMGAKPTATSSASANGADTMFAQMMIPHHEQAVEMSEMVLAKPGVDPRVGDLAQQIKAAQAPEVARLKGWLGEWGQPASMSGGHEGHGSGGMMSGMLKDEDLAQLRSADGAAASKLFLTQMIAHHEGAVEMAMTEKASGKHPGPVQMAASIIDSQTKEVEAMKGLLAQL
jgi:uncharacterized protein (DUF305 family)